MFIEESYPILLNWT